MNKLIVVMLVLFVLLSSCSGPVATPTTVPTPIPRTDLSSLSVSGLVDKITNGDLLAAVFATQEVLARGGMKTADLDRVYLEAYIPSATMSASPEETLSLTLEAQQKAISGTMTVSELGQMLSDLGWPFSAETTPGETIVSFLSTWVVEAQKVPNDPHSFAPLFLAEMAIRQSPPVDLAVGDASPDQIRLTLLELELIVAAFDRGITQPASYDQQKPHGLARAAFLQADEPCTFAKKVLAGPWFGQVVDVVHGEMTSKSIEVALTNAGVSAENRETFGNALAALGIAAKIWKTVVYYKYASVRVVASNTAVHKPLEGQSKYVIFTTRAGVSPEEWEEYQKHFGPKAINPAAQTAYRAMRDCLSAYGLPVLTDLGDIAKDAENWYVEWEIVPKDSPHVEIKLGGTHPADDENVFALPGQLQNKLKRVSPTSTETDLRLTIKTEKESDHPGSEVHDSVKVCANVQAGGSPPSLGTLVNAAKGGLGLIDSLVEVGAGWLQTMLKPSSCATLDISFHKPYRFKIEGNVNYQCNASDISGEWSEHMDTQFSTVLGRGYADTRDDLNTTFLAPVNLSSRHIEYGAGYYCDSGTITGEAKWRASGSIMENILQLDLGVDASINQNDPTDFGWRELPWLCAWGHIESSIPPSVVISLDLPLGEGRTKQLDDGRTVVGLENATGLDLGVPRTYRFTVTPGAFGTCGSNLSSSFTSVASWELTTTWLSSDSP